MLHALTLDLYAREEPHVNLLGVVATFDCRNDPYTPEPLSYGRRWPAERDDWTARLVHLQAGRLILTREQVAAAVGEAPVRAAEAELGERLDEGRAAA